MPVVVVAMWRRTEVLALRAVRYVDEQPGIALQQVGHLLAISPREIPLTGDRLPPNLIQKLCAVKLETGLEEKWLMLNCGGRPAMPARQLTMTANGTSAH